MAGRDLIVNGETLKVSNADKVLYPDVQLSKGDVIDYYGDVADVMLPHLAGRPLSMRRFPDGIEHDGFFQKDASDYFPSWIRRVPVPQRSGAEDVHHVVCDDNRTLLYLANQAVLEFHAWQSRDHALECPDRLTIDIDPPDNVGLTELREVARRVRDLFGSLGLAPFVQATGGRGFHVVAVLDGTADYDVVRPLARALADHLAGADPDVLTTEQRKARREDRIFRDTSRNAYGQTVVVPYSLRARPGAPVATPLEWSELGRAAPASHRYDSVRKRLAQKADPWTGMARQAGSARQARRKLDELRKGD